MKALVLATGTIAALVLSHAADAQGDAAKGKIRAQGCAACHNTERLNLAGRDSAGLVATMNKIKEGKMPHPPGFESFNDADINDIAAYLSSLKR